MDANSEPARQVWIFGESDYRFGSGALRMIVDRVDWSKPLSYDGETWYEIYGIEVSADGRVIGPRCTTVRAGRLSSAHSRPRPPGGGP